MTETTGQGNDFPIFSKWEAIANIFECNPNIAQQMKVDDVANLSSKEIERIWNILFVKMHIDMPIDKESEQATAELIERIGRES